MEKISKNMWRTEIDGDEVFLKKDWTGFRTVEPIVHPVTKKFIKKNFLSRKGFIILGFIIVILLLAYLGFREQLANYLSVLENPCQFCKEGFQTVKNNLVIP